MEMYVKGKEDTFICAPAVIRKNFPVSSREEPKKGAGVSKKEVQQFSLNKQKKEARNLIQ